VPHAFLTSYVTATPSKKYLETEILPLRRHLSQACGICQKDGLSSRPQITEKVFGLDLKQITNEFTAVKGSL